MCTFSPAHATGDDLQEPATGDDLERDDRRRAKRTGSRDRWRSRWVGRARSALTARCHQ